uniref:Uncharacterized protein n=1 Tax=Oryza sativa subsp. japonica TaxID=39947 RepID=Q2QVG2_ORYSJ|nr:hypothetical protein LOC_Os12g12920 [Oryza sativa Japonica Group]
MGRGGRKRRGGGDYDSYHRDILSQRGVAVLMEGVMRVARLLIEQEPTTQL